jgi:hypothetical protein
VILWAGPEEGVRTATNGSTESGTPLFEASGNDRDSHFTFGLERTLDGVERLVRERATRSEDETGDR